MEESFIVYPHLNILFFCIQDKRTKKYWDLSRILFIYLVANTICTCIVLPIITAFLYPQLFCIKFVYFSNSRFLVKPISFIMVLNLFFCVWVVHDFDRKECFDRRSRLCEVIIDFKWWVIFEFINSF